VSVCVECWLELFPLSSRNRCASIFNMLPLLAPRPHPRGKEAVGSRKKQQTQSCSAAIAIWCLLYVMELCGECRVPQFPSLGPAFPFSLPFLFWPLWLLVSANFPWLTICRIHESKSLQSLFTGVCKHSFAVDSRL